MRKEMKLKKKLIIDANNSDENNEKEREGKPKPIFNRNNLYKRQTMNASRLIGDLRAMDAMKKRGSLLKRRDTFIIKKDSSKVIKVGGK